MRVLNSDRTHRYGVTMPGKRVDPLPQRPRALDRSVVGSDRRCRFRTLETWPAAASACRCVYGANTSQHRAFAAYPIEGFDRGGLAFPRDGTLIFVGTYFQIGHWTRLASAARHPLQTDQPERLAKDVERL